MSVGLSVYTANKILDAMFNNTSFAITNIYVKLHVGDPGAAGTDNPAAETLRKVGSFGVTGGGGVVSDTLITWSSITGAEDATHASLWDHLTAGNFICSGIITAAGYLAGDNWSIPIGGIVLQFPVAA